MQDGGGILVVPAQGGEGTKVMGSLLMKANHLSVLATPLHWQCGDHGETAFVLGSTHTISLIRMTAE